MDRQPIARQEALADLLVLTGLCMLGMVVFSAAGLYLVSVFTDVEAMELANLGYPDESNPQLRTAVLILQGTIAAGSFILLPSLIRYFRPPLLRPPGLRPSITMLLLVTGLGLLMLPVNAWLAAWNQSIQLPGFFQDLQSWAWEKEKEMERLTSFLVDFSGTSEGLLGFAVIALMAGISEEFFFRKLLQPRLITLTGNPHAGIWLTAFIFSAIHIQFFGLVPRMALGALFGYYYFWTGNIGLSMFAHAFNNGITLLGLVLYQQKVSPLNVEDPSEIPWYLGGIAAGLVWSLSGMVREEAIKIRRILKQKQAAAA
jgi:membrane protease YdiL (CAAX protease family)